LNIALRQHLPKAPTFGGLIFFGLFIQTNKPTVAKLGSPATVLLAQKLNCHPGEQVSFE
jgi:hypothetical protein